MCQLAIEFKTHLRENNPISQSFLDENRIKLGNSCFRVLKALMSGIDLTSDNSKQLTGASYLPIRIKDLRDMGFTISDEWVIVDGKKSHKRWFMTEADKAHAAVVIMNLLKEVA